MKFMSVVRAQWNSQAFALRSAMEIVEHGSKHNNISDCRVSLSHPHGVEDYWIIHRLSTPDFRGLDAPRRTNYGYLYHSSDYYC